MLEEHLIANFELMDDSIGLRNSFVTVPRKPGSWLCRKADNIHGLSPLLGQVKRPKGCLSFKHNNLK